MPPDVKSMWNPAAVIHFYVKCSVALVIKTSWMSISSWLWCTCSESYWMCYQCTIIEMLGIGTLLQRTVKSDHELATGLIFFSATCSEIILDPELMISLIGMGWFVELRRRWCAMSLSAAMYLSKHRVHYSWLNGQLLYNFTPLNYLTAYSSTPKCL